MAYVLKDQQTTDNDFWGIGSGREYLGSSWVAGSSYTLHRIECKLNKVDTVVGNVVCQVYSDNGSGFPNAALATATNSIDSSTLPTTADYTPTFDFAGLALTGSTRYHIVLHGTGTDGGFGASGTVQWRSNTDGVSGENLRWDADGTGPFTNTVRTNTQADFKTYNNDAGAAYGLPSFSFVGGNIF